MTDEAYSTDQTEAVLLYQARYVLRDQHAKAPNCGYSKMAAACERAADRTLMDAPPDRPEPVSGSRLYRHIYLADLGYVVYRHCFDEKECAVIHGARVHQEAIFRDENSAFDYCIYRNALLDQNGTDELPALRIWQPGETLTMQQQMSARRVPFGQPRRLYDVRFKINEAGEPEWSGGMEPTTETIAQARRRVLMGRT